MGCSLCLDLQQGRLFLSFRSQVKQQTFQTAAQGKPPPSTLSLSHEPTPKYLLLTETTFPNLLVILSQGQSTIQEHHLEADHLSSPLQPQNLGCSSSPTLHHFQFYLHIILHYFKSNSTYTFVCIFLTLHIFPHYFIIQNGLQHIIGTQSKTTADGNCSNEIKRHLLLGRKVMTSLDNILKSRDITLPTKVCLVKATLFPVVMYGCESWSIKKDEC